ncbi:hypothetical protein [Qipengyuania soli]|uniref:GDT1 family protein n=1 Tax=Qipengyuania soli TaxID=2782568 RepID=A0A7S8F4T6_9SPHN|nr:hypothetical protein [Qipengyuania soli]QPC99189.1 hypothetical protein IRL76_00975 [Qipengyuania soli]
MTAFLFALLAAFAAGSGARDQVLVGTLRDRLGQSGGLLVTGLATALATALIAAWCGALIGSTMSNDASTMFVAIAMLVAAIECALPRRLISPDEPTRSLGAIGIVLFARQLTDAARFLVLAVAAAYAAPEMAAVGGAVGGMVIVAIGWTLGKDGLDRLPLRTIRHFVAIFLFLVAVSTALSARGIIG